jgi:hypothetical protein
VFSQQRKITQWKTNGGTERYYGTKGDYLECMKDREQENGEIRNQEDQRILLFANMEVDLDPAFQKNFGSGSPATFKKKK